MNKVIDMNMNQEFEFPENPVSKEVQDFLDNGGVITKIAPEQTADTLAKENGGYYQGFNNTWTPNKKQKEEV
jgi:hypothetical protein